MMTNFRWLRRVSLAALCVVGVSSCATGAGGGADVATPLKVAANIAPYLGKTMHWGGRIVQTKNLRQGTEVEIVAYKLARNGRPDIRTAPLGRFIVFKDTYLEPIDYAAGKLVSVKGYVTKTRDGKVGQSSYRFTVLKAETLKLWKEARTATKPRVNVGFSIGSGGRSGIGIGLGF